MIAQELNEMYGGRERVGEQCKERYMTNLSKTKSYKSIGWTE